ncbi:MULTISPECIES: hypothetical protein [Pseudomonas]|uniref:hypothetical protein n=1 Tax=Pseudomonas TaxID=286 RepID=UPI000CD4B06C|nr:MULTISPECIES: hypothetical protein [Pseudomonas]MPQ68758.1 hypothetical protein [Pseudomonas sp. MWU12-2323]RBH54195.1 hypothetical protein C3F00_024450 [Pseudomonas sp. MWU13-2860]
MEDNDSIPKEWRITLNQFISFLVKVGRSSSCPVCPHDGEWNFYIDKSLGMGVESCMMITRMDGMSPEDLFSERVAHPTFSMECPSCGYMAYTSVKKVVEGLSAMEKENG